MSLSGAETCCLLLGTGAQLRASPALPSLCPGLGHPPSLSSAAWTTLGWFSAAQVQVLPERNPGAWVWRALPSCRGPGASLSGGRQGGALRPWGPSRAPRKCCPSVPLTPSSGRALPCRVALSCGRRVLDPRVHGVRQERPRPDGLFQWTLFSLRRDWRLPGPRPCSLRQRLAGGSLEQPGVSGSLLGDDCGSEVRRQGVRGAWGPLSWNSHGEGVPSGGAALASVLPPGTRLLVGQLCSPRAARTGRGCEGPLSLCPWFALFLWVPW